MGARVDQTNMYWLYAIYERKTHVNSFYGGKISFQTKGFLFYIICESITLYDCRNKLAYFNINKK